MSKFFKKEKNEAKPVEKKTSKKKKEKVFDCSTCTLNKGDGFLSFDCQGKGKKKVLIVSEFPNKVEFEQGLFEDRDGEYLRNCLSNIDVDLDEDCWYVPAVQCFPGNRGLPTTNNVNCCRSRLKELITKLNPERIIVLGPIALQVLYGDKVKIGKSLLHYAGAFIPDQDYGCFVCPIPSPYFVLHENNPIVAQRFKLYLKKVFRSKRKFIQYDYESKIEIIQDVDKAVDFLDTIKKGSKIVIDLETTGLKPHRKGHKIICISIAISENKSVSFPIFDDLLFVGKLKSILSDPQIYKIAHNLKFEDTWIFYKLVGCKVKGWIWDTLITAHVQDNIAKINLKFLTMIRYGIKGYDDLIAPFLKSVDGYANSFNRIEEVPIEDVLKYCALDSLFTYWIFNSQQNELTETQRQANDFLFQGILALCDVEKKGILTDQKHYAEQEIVLSELMEKASSEIMESKEVSKWDEEEFNFNSTKQLKHLLFDILKYKPLKETAKGNPSLDEDSLSSYKTPFTDKIIEWRKLAKLKNTYVASFQREAVDNVIYPFFHLHPVATYRSSSSDPNFQNIPKRDEDAQRMIRTGIIPRENSYIIEFDYKGVEVAISACYHKDPAMIKYIEDPTTDMHRDQAMEIFMVGQNEVTKDMRFLSKNGFVFPQFYGDYYASCADNIWAMATNEVKEVLRKNGIRTNRQFQNHLEEVEYKFWNDKFPVYDEWKTKSWEEYMQKGFIESLTGFRYSGIMRKNEALNYPIQGSAFHCLLWSLIKLNLFLENSSQYKSFIFGQIHDALVMNIYKDEFNALYPIIEKVMCVDLKKAWEWIIVPLSIEAEYSDKSWFDLKKVNKN